MAVQLGEGQSHFGPPVYLQEDIGEEYRSVEVDVVRMGDNLRRDFPEIGQEEWDMAMIYLSDRLPPYFGGYSANILPLRNSLSARVLHGSAKRVANFFLDQPNVEPSYRELEEISDGRDIVVEVNVASEVGEPVGKNGRFFPEGENLDPSTIFSHELQHTVGQLIDNRNYRRYMEEINRWWRRAAAHAGSVATGLAFGGAGTLTSVMSLSPFAETPFLIGSGAMATGAVMVTSPIYMALKRKSLSIQKLGIEKPEPPYSGGEDSAHAYALAARESWQDIIALPSPTA